MENAIVLDGHIKSALATVRSLGRSGVPVSVGALRPTAMSMHSKYTQHTFVYPSPYTDQEGFVRAVQKEAERLGGKPVVYAFSDATFLSLYAYRELLRDSVSVVYPEEKSIEIAFDKAATYSLARVSGVPTIPTYTPESQDELRLVMETATYPVVLKPRKSVTWKDGRGVFGTATFVKNAQELQSKFNTLRTQVGESPMIQTFIRGEEYGVEMLADKGNAYASVVHHRLRSLSPTGGASVLKEVLEDGDLKHTLISYAEVLVQKLSWSGPVMVEYKVDADTREVYLMEVNGRFWGSLPLSICAGVDVPMLYFNAVKYQAFPDEVVVGKEGVMSVHRLGDMVHLMRVWFGSSNMRKELYPSRMSALREFFSVPRGTSDDVWSLHDLKPACMEIVDILKSTFSK